jgi:two-component sensor histidine kinase
MQEQNKKAERKLLDKEFLDYYLTSSKPSMSVGLAVTLMLFITYAVANRLIFGESPEQKYFLKFGLIVPAILVSLIVLYIKPLQRHLSLIFVLVNLYTCIAIFYVGATSEADSKGYNYFYAWVMLVMIGMHTFYRIRFRDLMILNILQFFSYLMATLVNRSFTMLFLFFNHMFFVISVTSLGFFTSYIFQRLNWKNYLHQRALSENYRNLVREMKERKDAQEALALSEQQYHEALDGLPDWVISVDRDLQVIMVNSSLKQVASEAGLYMELTGVNAAEAMPFISHTEIDSVRKVFETGMISIGELSFDFQGRHVVVETRKIPIIRGNVVEKVMIVVRDRSREKEIDQLRQRNAETKEVMLKEIHHRVKNNLAIVISLLGMQGKKKPDADSQRLLKDIELRIRTMALIHEHLYRAENLDRIHLPNYITSLITMISSTFSSPKIHIETEFDEITASIESALPLGLITNELLTNAYKYAFRGEVSGRIRIQLHHTENGGYCLSVSDNGIGLPEGFEPEKQDSLGMFMIRLLAEQLDGRVSFTSAGGVCAKIDIPQL